MDKLRKLKYSNTKMLYNYKGIVEFPALEMVDDVVDVQKCGVDAIQSNAIVNWFMEHKKCNKKNIVDRKVSCVKNKYNMVAYIYSLPIWPCPREIWHRE